MLEEFMLSKGMILFVNGKVLKKMLVKLDL